MDIIALIRQDPILSNLASNAIWFLVAAIAYRFRRNIASIAVLNTVKLTTKWWLAGAVCVLIVGVDRFIFGGSGFVGLIVSVSLIFAFGYVLLRPLSAAGIVGAHQTTANGVNYDQSLRLVRSKLDFLGIGADKLGKSSEFEAALVRASRGSSPVRLLLSKPDNPILMQAANRAGINPKEYQSRVKASLARLRSLKFDKGINIEVRFYSSSSLRDYQQFRLIFIDDDICIVSYTVWDKGDGRSNPQVVLRSVKGDRNRQLISAFSDYFQRIWDDPSTEPADLTKFR